MAEDLNLDPLLNPSKTTFISKNPFKSSYHPNRRASIAAYTPTKWDNATKIRRRRYSSILKPDSSTQFIAPHYLRASTGSCHDICKYGRRHSCEEKPQKPLNKITSSLGKQKKEKLFKNDPSLDDTKKGSLSLKPFIVSKYYSPKRELSSGPTMQNDLSKHYLPNLKTHSCDETHNPRQNFILKKPFVVSKCYSPKLIPSSGAKTHFPSNRTRFFPNSTSKKSCLSYPPEVIKGEILPPAKKVKDPVRGVKSIDKKMSRMVKKKCDQPVKSKPISSFKNSDEMHGKLGRKNDVKNGTLSTKKPLVPRVAMLSPKFSVTKKMYLKARKGGAHKFLPPVQGRNRVRRIIESARSNGGDSLKTLYVIKSETKKSPSSLPRGNETDEIICDKIACVEIVKVQPVSENMVPMAIGEVQPVKQNHDKTEETGTENKNVEDSISDNHGKAQSLLNCDEAADDINKEQPSKENHNKAQRKGKPVISEDKHSPPVKLKFRRGKIIELQHDNNNNNIPRKLRFRRSSRIYGNTEGDFAPDNKRSPTSTKSHMVVSEDRYISPTKLLRSTGRFVDLHADNNTPRRLKFGQPRFVVGDENRRCDDLFRRRSFKRSGSKDDLAGSDFSSRRVTLKCRNNLQRKKDNQLLFNNVIEETASKLVESRKSKVKALVGAFETVISLQERHL